ncbi:hypothetical protein PtB15_11B212 [Puccinia triticina]|nr:hypothetical protein PtB15_11B212 [Puccinia triticina]
MSQACSYRSNANAQNSTHLRSNEQNWACSFDDQVVLILTPSEVNPWDFGHIAARIWAFPSAQGALRGPLGASWDDGEYGPRPPERLPQRRLHAPLMNDSMSEPRGMMMGGPYGSYMPPIYPPYGPTHSYPPPMAGPSLMFPIGSMMGRSWIWGTWETWTLARPTRLPSSPTPPPADPIQSPNGNNRRLGEQISRHFAEEIRLPLHPHYHDKKGS